MICHPCYPLKKTTQLPKIALEVAGNRRGMLGCTQPRRLAAVAVARRIAEEVGCDIWGLLSSIKSICGEPVCLWLPKKYIKANTSEYVQGVEVSMDYSGKVPDGFDIIELPKCKYLMFQGEPFEEENFCEAIEQVCDAIKKYNPNINGFAWDNENPRIQLEPIGRRGYIELHPVKNI